MNNKNIIKQVSSGGFIFYKDKKTLKIYVLLIKNKKGEWWIPKGNLENGESQLDAAFREINELVGFDFYKLRYIDFCDTHSYGYDLDKKNFLIKDLFINIFESNNMYPPDPQKKYNDDIKWILYEEALDVISFTKDKLERSYEKFIKAVSTINPLYSMAIAKIQQELKQIECIDNISSVVLYGSMYKKIFEIDVHDTDLIIVVKDVSKDVSGLFISLNKIFSKLDFHIYSEDEVTKNVAFYSREYVLEYLSKGICLYGSNPFVDLYKNVTHEQYKNSIFIRTVYHVQTVRKVYLSQINTFEYKLNYLKKYIQRIGKNILMFMGLAEYDSLEKVSAEFLLSELIKHKLIKSAETEGFNDLKPLEYYYNIFTDLSNNLPELRKNIRVDTESL